MGQPIRLVVFLTNLFLECNRECIEHNYASVEQCGNILPEECQDHDYYTKTEIKNYFEIDPKYADDISWATTAKQRITYIKETTPSTLAKRNMVINESKTEDYEIIRQGNEKWKNCKLLGSLLDTEKDINRRQILAIDAFKTLNQIFDSRKMSNTVKIRTFNAYVASVFLYNSELWTLTKKLERRQLRKILGLHWPKKITNIELYIKIKTEVWSTTIQRRRLKWLGHLMRLHPETPARLALAEYLRKVKRPKGRPQRTWMELIKHDLKAIILLDYNKPNKTIEQLTQMAHDRNYWRNIVRRVVLQK